MDADLPAIATIALAYGDEGAGSASDPRYVTHLRRSGAFLVAERAGEVAGYCATRRVGDATMLCDLFVAPDRHGGGIGGRLLDAAFAGAEERFTFASRDPRAMPLYVRHGMVPRWPLLYLSGPPTGRSPLTAGAVPVMEAAVAELRLTGQDRGADYAYWEAGAGCRGVIVQDGDEAVAAGVTAPGRLVHLVSARHADPVATLIAALGAVPAGAGRVRLCLPGPHPALPRLLAARWRIEEYDHHMSSDPYLLSPGHVPSASLA